MLAGINDSEEVAHQLGTLLKDREVVGFNQMHLTIWIAICHDAVCFDAILEILVK